MFKKIFLLIFMLLQAIFPIYAVAKESVKYTTTLEIEKEIKEIENLLDANLGKFLKSNERFQLCTISLWIARTMKDDETFIEYIHKIGITEFRSRCISLLREIKSQTEGVKDIGHIKAYNFFLLACHTLNYNWW